MSRRISSIQRSGSAPRFKPGRVCVCRPRVNERPRSSNASRAARCPAAGGGGDGEEARPPSPPPLSMRACSNFCSRANVRKSGPGKRHGPRSWRETRPMSSSDSMPSWARAGMRRARPAPSPHAFQEGVPGCEGGCLEDTRGERCGAVERQRRRERQREQLRGCQSGPGSRAPREGPGAARAPARSSRLRRRGMPHFAVHRRNFMPVFYGASGMFLRPRKIPL